jgi:hypothetical protein
MSPTAKKDKPTKYRPLLEASQRVGVLWQDFRKCYAKAYSSQEITRDTEQRFLEVKSELARLLRLLSRQLPEGAQYGAKDIGELMAQCVSVGSIQDLPLNDKKALYEKWHQSHIQIKRLEGALEVMDSGFPVHFRVKKAGSGNIKGDLAGPAKKQKSNKATVVVVIIIIAAAAYYFTRS